MMRATILIGILYLFLISSHLTPLSIDPYVAKLYSYDNDNDVDNTSALVQVCWPNGC